MYSIVFLTILYYLSRVELLSVNA